MNPCDQWAEAFVRDRGGTMVLIRPRSPSDNVLGPVTGHDSGDWAYHRAVVLGGKVYDERHPDGVSPAEYKAQWEYAEDIDFGGM